MDLDTHDFNDYGICTVCGERDSTATECPGAHRDEPSDDIYLDCPLCFRLEVVILTDKGAYRCTACLKIVTKQVVAAVDMDRYKPLEFE